MICLEQEEKKKGRETIKPYLPLIDHVPEHTLFLVIYILKKWK